MRRAKWADEAPLCAGEATEISVFPALFWLDLRWERDHAKSGVTFPFTSGAG